VAEHLTDLRHLAADQQILYSSLRIGFGVGLIVHVAGYALKSSTTTEPLGLIADLLYALGWALWTGVVVVVFVEIIPRSKRRQIKQMLATYEAGAPEEARVGSDETPGDV
jgi:hypothetical protein